MLITRLDIVVHMQSKKCFLNYGQFFLDWEKLELNIVSNSIKKSVNQIYIILGIIVENKYCS